MLFNSADFLIFFPIVFIVYYICPMQIRYLWILIASYYFYMQWNPKYLVLLFGCTLVTYVAGLFLERLKRNNDLLRPKKYCLTISLLIVLSVLAFFKYYDFGMLYINKFLSIVHIPEIHKSFDIILPVGISFFT